MKLLSTLFSERALAALLLVPTLPLAVAAASPMPYHHGGIAPQVSPAVTQQWPCSPDTAMALPAPYEHGGRAY